MTFHEMCNINEFDCKIFLNNEFKKCLYYTTMYYCLYNTSIMFSLLITIEKGITFFCTVSTRPQHLRESTI